jgi:hypothetical protein
MLSESLTKFADNLASNMTNAEPSAYEMRLARKLKSKLEDLRLLDIYHPRLQPLIVEFLARELAAARHASPAPTRREPLGRRRPTKR